MTFWKTKKPAHSVCAECGVHFEPVTGYESTWGHLCATHRKPVRERDEKRAAVISWAASKWEHLVPMMEEDTAKTQEQYNNALSAHMASLANASQSHRSSQYGNEIGAWGIGGPYR